MALLEGRDLVVDGRDRRVLDVASFDVRAGETHVVLGPNGAGKSTLLRVLSCLIPGEGRLAFGGRDVTTAADRLALRRATASVFQQAYLLNTSVRGNVESGLRLRGVRGAALRARADAALELLGIAHLAERGRAKLSGGESQRVSVARALAVDPQVVFLDEPMASLDPPTRRGLLRDLGEIFAAGTMAAIWVTHDKDEALEVGDRVSFLEDGSVVQSGTGLEVFSRPVNEGVASYLGLETYLEGVATPAGEGVARLTLASGATILCAAGVEGPAVACVFPEDVVLFSVAPAATSLRNIVAGTIREVTLAGRLRRVAVAGEGFEVAAVVTHAALEELDLVVGSSVVAAFKASAVHLIPRSGVVRSESDG